MMGVLKPVGPLNHRTLMGTWTTGVSLVTTTTADDRPTGCTLNSLTSLSLEPPSVLMCLDTDSRTLAAIRDRGRFCVNVLGSSQEPLSRRFADRSLSNDERFESLDYDNVLGVPVLRGCMATLVCQVMDMTLLCDHILIAGHVIHGAEDTSQQPLIFFRGAYQAMSADDARVSS